MEIEREREKIANMDTPTNRQAILLMVKRYRSGGLWCSYADVTQMIFPEYDLNWNKLRAPVEYEWRRQVSNAVRDLCLKMRDEDLLTFSAHGYLGVGENAPF